MKKLFFKRAVVFIAALALLVTGFVKTPAVGGKTAQAQTTGTLRNVLYYGDWSIWGGQGNFYPKGIAADQITHLNFAFLDFDSSGNLIFTDKDAATGAPVGMDGVTWGAANGGILNAFQQLRAENPNLHIGVSLGGWSRSGDFSTVAASDATRKAFVSNVCKFVKYCNMDFVDIDWEYPCSKRSPDLVDNAKDEGTPNASPADKANYILLLKEFRKQLDAQGAALGRTYELSVALSASKANLEEGIDIPQLFSVVDFANMMTYDLRGSWDEYSGHQTPLYTNPADPYASSGYSIDDCVKYLLSKGAPSQKIVVGAAFYTRGWEKVSAGPNSSLPGLFGAAALCAKDADLSATRGAANEAALSVGDGGHRGGVWSYRSLSKLKAAYPGLVEYWDDTAKAPYLYNASTGAFFTYDNVRSVTAKADYVKANNLGGMISWMASQDAETGTSGKRDELITAIKKGLFGSAALPAYPLPTSALDVNCSVTASGNVYTITIKNNATANESGEVLSLVETAGETIKAPKLYIKTNSGATFSASGYGCGTVTNSNGYGIADMAVVYDNKLIGQGATLSLIHI